MALETTRPPAEVLECALKSVICQIFLILHHEKSDHGNALYILFQLSHGGNSSRN